MQDNLFLADLSNQSDWMNDLFLILAIGTAIAALIWLLLWLLGMDNDSSEGSGGKTSTASSTGDEVNKEKSEKPDQPAKPAKAEVSGDDFTKLGLSAATIAALNGRGITKYDQIADWKSSEVTGFDADFGASESGVKSAELPWRANALAGGIDLDKVDPKDPAFGIPFEAPSAVDHDALIKADFAGEEVTNDADLGIVYAKGAKASHEDDLKTIKGVGPVISKELNGYGVHCYKQIAAWSDHNVSEFSERLNCFKNRIERDRWIPQAAGFECEGEAVEEFSAASSEEAASVFAADLESGTVKQDDVYGILYAEKPDDVDDLKKIKGVGKVLEGKLNSIGVYRFKQVGVWTEPACKEFAKLLTAFKDRIYRDNWIAQAKGFHNDKYDDKL